MDYQNWTYTPELARDYDDEGTSYTWSDVLSIANGNEILAQSIIDLCDWQYPETILDELLMEEEVIEVNGQYFMQYNDEQLENLWQDFADVPINYPDKDTGEYLDVDPDGELNDKWFIFDAGTPRMEIWKWFDKRYSGGLTNLLWAK